MPGWIDTISAVGSVMFFAGLGIMKEHTCDSESSLDIIPVDFVVNDVLKGIHHVITTTTPTHHPFTVVHSAASGVSKGAMIRSLRRYVRMYYAAHRPSKAVDDFSFTFIPSPLVFSLRFFSPSRVAILFGSKTHPRKSACVHVHPEADAATAASGPLCEEVQHFDEAVLFFGLEISEGPDERD